MFRRSVIAALLVLLVAGCSSGGAATPASPAVTDSPTPSQAPIPTQPPTPSPTPAGFVQAYEPCRAVVQAELDLLAEITTRLTTGGGINIKDYSPLVNTLLRAGPDGYAGLSGGANRYCRNVALQDVASSALDHMQANSGWSNCLAMPSSMEQTCIDKVVQRWWSKASADYARALADMASLQQGLIPNLDPDPVYDEQSPKPTYTPDEVANMDCDRAYDDVISDVYVLGVKLREGVTVHEYGSKVEAASSDLSKADTAGLSGTCLISIGAVLNTVINDHLDAWTAWQGCLSKQKTKPKFDACFSRNVDTIWTGRLTDSYAKLFDGMGTLYLNQATVIPLF